jgi:AcrR family transcriptional regulator
MRQVARVISRSRGPNKSLKVGRARGQARREARRALMVKAAVRAIRRLGSAATMADIAHEAGVSKPILYRQFADKADLHAEVAGRAAIALMDKLRVASDGEPHRHRQLSSVISAYLEYVERESRLVGFLRQVPVGIPASAQRPARDLAATLSARIASILRERLGAAGRDPSPADVWAVALVGYVQAAADWWLASRAVPHTVLAEQLTWLMWNGFAGLDRAEARVGAGDEC